MSPYRGRILSETPIPCPKIIIWLNLCGWHIFEKNSYNNSVSHYCQQKCVVSFRQTKILKERLMIYISQGYITQGYKLTFLHWSDGYYKPNFYEKYEIAESVEMWNMLIYPVKYDYFLKYRTSQIKHMWMPLVFELSKIMKRKKERESCVFFSMACL